MNALCELAQRPSIHARREEPGIRFIDRFLTIPPGFYPVEAAAGLSSTAPQAAGVAALAKSVNPKLTPQQIERLIFENSTPIGNGKVRIPDAYKIVVTAQEMARGTRQSDNPRSARDDSE